MENMSQGFPACAGRFRGDSAAGNQGSGTQTGSAEHARGEGIPAGLGPGEEGLWGPGGAGGGSWPLC